MKAFTILRVSTEGQLDRYGPDVQWQDDILPNAPLLGLEVSEEYRRIIQESATSWNRPIFEATINEAIELYHAGKIEAIIYPRVDRESRFILSSLPTLVRCLQSGIKVYFGREKLYFDPNDPECVNEYLSKNEKATDYAETVRKNTGRGKRQRALTGKLPGGGQKLFGYTYTKDTGKYVVNEYEEGIVKRIFNWLINDRVSCRELCRRLMADKIPAPNGGNVWNRSTIRRIVTNKQYTGECYVYKTITVKDTTGKKKHVPAPANQWIKLPDAIPAIITADDYETAQRQLTNNRSLSGPNTRKHSYLLKGHLKCGICGHNFVGIPTHGKVYYRCANKEKLRGHCGNRTYSAPTLEHDVWAEVEKIINDPGVLTDKQKRTDNGDGISKLQNEANKKLERINKLNAKEEATVEFYAGLDDDREQNAEKTAKAVKKIRAEKELLTRELVDLEKNIQKLERAVIQKENIKNYCALVRQKTDRLDFAGKRLALEALNIVVTLDRENPPLVEIDIPDVSGMLANTLRCRSQIPENTLHFAVSI